MHPDDARLNQADPSRRAFLVGAAAAAALPLIEWQSILSAQEPDAKPGAAADAFPGMITRQRMPDNLEFPFASVDSFLTPNERFYVRTHFENPEIDADEWRLSVAGKVRKPLTLSYDDLRDAFAHRHGAVGMFRQQPRLSQAAAKWASLGARGRRQRRMEGRIAPEHVPIGKNDGS